jgi:uncharacterized protein
MMKKTMQGVSAVALLLLLMVAACSKIPDDNNSLFGNYDQATMLNNIGNTILLSGINNLSASATAAAGAISAFTSSPTDNTLTAAQTAWETLSQNWATSAPFDFGPMNDNLISPNLDTWPANDSKIENAISAQSNATNVGADTKGLKGLEYLLFDKNGNTAVLAKYTGSDAANRKAFLNSVVQDVVTQSAGLQNGWNTGYLNSFATAKGNDVSSSVSQMVNAIALYLDNIKTLKVGNPIGMGVKVNDNQPHPDKIEYTLAEESLPVMKANVLAMKAAFDGGSGQGLDDLLDYTKAQKNGQNLSAVIDGQFDDVVNKIKLINPPYATAVSTQTAQVQDVFNSLKTLITYFKVDAANNLGVTITFSDTDGD